MAYLENWRQLWWDLNTTYVDDQRYYVTPRGKIYPSITTILSRYKEPSLNEWKNRVGPDAAERIRDKAAIFGTKIHDMCEAYIGGKELPEHNHLHRARYQVLRRIIDKNIGAVYALECPLYSDRLKIAGRTDVIGQWSGIPSLIDWKNSDKPKRREWIDNYFMQGAAYSCMWAERTGSRETTPRQIVIVNTVPHEDEPQIFIEPVAKWIKPLENVISEFGGEIHDRLSRVS